jgi:transcriptional regulator with XRE-family HTH domain
MRNKEYRDSFVAANISNTISAQIHNMRESRKWTQTELATRCDMRQPRISALEDPECENVEIATLRRVASAFDVALSVRFVPFSEIARQASSLTPSDFVVHDYTNDALESRERQEVSAMSVTPIQVVFYNTKGTSINIPAIASPNHQTEVLSIPLSMSPVTAQLSLMRH